MCASCASASVAQTRRTRQAINPPVSRKTPRASAAVTQDPPLPCAHITGSRRTQTLATFRILSISLPSKHSCGDSRRDTDFPRTRTPERWQVEEKGDGFFRNSAQRRWEKCERNISVWEAGVMNVISYCVSSEPPNAAIPVQYFKRWLVFNAALSRA